MVWPASTGYWRCQRWFACKRNAKRLLNFYFLCLMQVSCHLVRQKKYKSMEEKLLGFFHIIANKVKASATGATVLLNVIA